MDINLKILAEELWEEAEELAKSPEVSGNPGKSATYKSISKILTDVDNELSARENEKKIALSYSELEISLAGQGRTIEQKIKEIQLVITFLKENEEVFQAKKHTFDGWISKLSAVGGSQTPERKGPKFSKSKPVKRISRGMSM